MLARIISALTLIGVLAVLLVVGSVTGHEPSLPLVLTLVGAIGGLLGVEALTRFMDRGGSE